ncbi:MAG: hypothetical protein DCF19_09600 [Pseudanabaena frigida]|uniref:Uncharacterized protein n=1 Tax=Pseudanabaena frigida TaxID=945775 RepID=A0A2W4YE85_9CYAN|nr:MAG: hypothetical protein DCF19_09600 [Pseudanabaena frigida]
MQEDHTNKYVSNPNDLATLVKNYKGFNVFFVEERYYALTSDYGELVLRKVAVNQCSLSASALLQMEDEIEEAISFSNSRGNFDNRFRQKVKGALMKAESVHDNQLGDSNISPALPSGKVMYVKELDSYFFVTPDELPMQNLSDLDSTIVNAYYASSQPELISTFGNYNLVSFDTKMFAVKQGVPIDDIDWRSGAIDNKVGVRCFSNTKDAIAYIKIQLKIEGAGTADTNEESSSAAPVVLLTDDTLAINYVFYAGLYYAVPYSLGHSNLEKIISEIPQGVIFSDSLDALKSFAEQQRINEPNYDRLIASGGSDVPIFLRAESEYNIVFFGGYYFAIPQSLGPIDLLEIDFMNVPEIVRDVSLYVIEDYIAEKTSQPKKTKDSTPQTPVGTSQMQHIRDVVVRQQDELKNITHTNEQQQVQLQKLLTELNNATAKITAMESSKFWKLRGLWFRVKNVLKKIKAVVKPSKQ